VALQPEVHRGHARDLLQHLSAFARPGRGSPPKPRIPEGVLPAFGGAADRGAAAAVCLVFAAVTQALGGARRRASLELLSERDDNDSMELPFSARAALLQALRQGPGYGSELVERIRRLTGHALAPGSVYPALRTLKRRRLVRGWTVVPGRRRGGRSRTYYELTYGGLLRALGEGGALGGLISGPQDRTSASRPTPAMLRRRLRRVSDLTEFLLRQRLPRYAST
jgi:hypothetical protein